ncbi:sialidase-3-like [Sardina pilchardus]|uniref:sialidase-3-like n=1 Tax=Sardina pilchardus TaxID=27697 RepID=UPI002E13B447
MGSSVAKSHSTETLVFADKDHDFRIPALLYVKEWSTFLAFAEKRASSKDEHAENLVMRKGSRQPDGSVQWSPTEDLMKASIVGFRTMNPCPVLERNSGTLFLFFICLKGNTLECMLRPGQTRLCYVTSGDRGLTWSDLTDLTASVMDSAFSQYQTFAVGPGHALQLASGALLVPAYVKLVEGRGCCRGGGGCVSTHSVVLRSQDGGCTWHAGQPLAMETGECQLAQVRDGAGGTQVYMNARSTGEWRVEALSSDGGESFRPLSLTTLPEVGKGCQGSVLSFPATELPAGGGAFSERGAGGGAFSQRGAGGGASSERGAGGGVSSERGAGGGTRGAGGGASSERGSGGGASSERGSGGGVSSERGAGGGASSERGAGGQGWDRLELGLYLTRCVQDPVPWGEPHIAHSGRSGYSDLARCEEEGRFACLMECGEGERLRMVFREFDLTEISHTV